MTLQLLALRICSSGVGGTHRASEVCFFDYRGKKKPTHTFVFMLGAQRAVSYSHPVNPATVGERPQPFRMLTQNVNNGDMIGDTGWNRLLIEGFHPTWQHV